MVGCCFGSGSVWLPASLCAVLAALFFAAQPFWSICGPLCLSFVLNPSYVFDHVEDDGALILYYRPFSASHGEDFAFSVFV